MRLPLPRCKPEPARVRESASLRNPIRRSKRTAPTPAAVPTIARRAGNPHSVPASMDPERCAPWTAGSKLRRRPRRRNRVLRCRCFPPTSGTGSRDQGDTMLPQTARSRPAPQSSQRESAAKPGPSAGAAPAAPNSKSGYRRTQPGGRASPRCPVPAGCIVGHSLAVAQALAAQSQQAKQMTRKKITLALLVGDIETVLSPGAVKKRNDPVIENIQEVSRRGVRSSQPFDDQRRVGIGKNSLWTGQPHEIHGHLHRSVFGAVQGLDLAGRERQRGVNCKTRNLGVRVREPAHRRPLRKQPFEQTHRLEEVKGERLATELLTDLGSG